MITTNEKLDPNWISGFIEGDGSFYIIINKKNNRVTATAFLSIYLNIREKIIIEKIKESFNGKGNIYISNTTYNMIEWKVYKIQDLISISSHFESYPLKGLKLNKFEARSEWKEILPLIEKKSYLNQTGLIKIKFLENKLKTLY